ncbi:MAG: hypothetical protein R3195_15105, partial [Gemmatimonadota bacterium]|nr:hypothetical protein [Gemmatimonadota bacterium]
NKGPDGQPAYPPETVRNPVASQFFDGRPHTWRIYFGMLGNDRYAVYVEIDGVVTHDYTTTSVDDAGLFYDYLMLGSNRNLGPLEDAYVIWQRMKVWTR